MEYGYVRVSTEEQNAGRQVEAMAAEGIPPERVFVDRASGRSMDRPEWERLLSALHPGDSVVIDSLDRLGRTYDGVTAEWRRLTREEGVSIRALDLPFFDSAGFAAMGDMGRCVEDMLLSLLAYVAQTEREKMLRRQAQGIALARAEGRYRGRARTEFDPDLVEEAQRALREEGKAAAARVLGVSRGTVYAMVGDGRLVA